MKTTTGWRSLSVSLALTWLAFTSLAFGADKTAVINRVTQAGATLVIDGANFAQGKAPLQVRMAGFDSSLPVLTYTDNQIIALLPPAANPGSYLISLWNGKPGEGNAGDEFFVTLAGAGPQGAKGDAGRDGVAGPQGAPGTVGPAGPQGPQGVVGPAGTQGPQGNAGPAGALGPQGNVGPVGAQGPQGNVGPAGPQGPQGIAGRDGVNGSSGGTLPSLDTLAGLPCNVSNTGRACRGTTTLEFEPNTHQMSLFCRPTLPQWTFTANVTMGFLAAGQVFTIEGVVTHPNLFLERYLPGQSGFDLEFLCDGTVFTWTFTLVHGATTTAPHNVEVTGGNCALATVVSNGPSVSCTVVMDSNQQMTVGSRVFP